MYRHWGKVKCTLVQALRLCTGRTAHRGSRGIALPFHDYGTRRGVRGQRHAPAALYLRERTGTYCTGGWVGPRAGLDMCGKSRPPPGFDLRTVQPVASRYTDWAIPVHSFSVHGVKWKKQDTSHGHLIVFNHTSRTHEKWTATKRKDKHVYRTVPVTFDTSDRSATTNIVAGQTWRRLATLERYTR